MTVSGSGADIFLVNRGYLPDAQPAPYVMLDRCIKGPRFVGQAEQREAIAQDVVQEQALARLDYNVWLMQKASNKGASGALSLGNLETV